MRVRVIGGVGDLAADLAHIATVSRIDMGDTVKTNANSGVRLAKGFAKSSAGAHGKHYPNAMSAEARGPLTWEYGPDSAKPQGGMSFEFGSRNQPPHLDLARSADIVGPRFANDVSRLPSRWFW